MARRTLLDLTQDILSEMNSDEVNSIGDTAESTQVAAIIKNKYYDIHSRAGLPKERVLFQLDPGPDEDPAIPTVMKIPTGFSEIEWIKYFDSNILDGSSPPSESFSHDLNVDVKSTTGGTVSAPGYKYITIIPLDQFMEFVNRFNPSATDVASYTFQGMTLYYKNDHFPRYCTIVSNTWVLFDQFDDTQDSTIQGGKTMCYGRFVTPFQMVDNFIPQLDDEQFPLLMNEAKALAFYSMKQMPHAKAEQEIKRQWSTLAKNKNEKKPGYFDELNNFGRVPKTGGYSGGYAANRWMRQSGP